LRDESSGDRGKQGRSRSACGPPSQGATSRNDGLC
jgi:hypothetical protein